MRKAGFFECGSHPYSHVCRVSHSTCTMGQDPPLCFLSTDRGYVLVFILPLTLPMRITKFLSSRWFCSDRIQVKALCSGLASFLPVGTSKKSSSFPNHLIFTLEELPVRLAHRVKELDELPHNLSAMPSIKKVKDWYAQSFDVWFSIFETLGI